MFTVKLYGYQGYRLQVLEAESLTVVYPSQLGHSPNYAEITLHRKDGGDTQVTVPSRDANTGASDNYERVIIENSAGRTTQIIQEPPDRELKMRSNPGQQPKISAPEIAGTGVPVQGTPPTTTGNIPCHHSNQLRPAGLFLENAA